MKAYSEPILKNISEIDSMLVSIQQYQIDLESQCSSAQSLGIELSVQDSLTGTMQLCENTDPPAGFSFILQCQETGSTSYTWSITSFSIGETCSDGNLYTATFDISPAMPGSCTVTSFVVTTEAGEICGQLL